MKSLQTDNMTGHQKLCGLIVCLAALIEYGSAFTKESRTAGLHIPEKIIGGVIDIVQSHKNKPVQGTQGNYPANQNYNYQQYPQYQQWNGQSSFQNQGFQQQPQPQLQPQPQPQPQPQGQYTNQGQYNYQNGYNQGTIPQGGNYNPTYPSTGQTFTQGQNQQGQYQVGYQNPNQFQQNQFQNTQSGYYTGQSQGSNQYQGTSTSQTGNSQSQTSAGSGQFSQGFLTTSGQSGNGNGQGPTCVCQAWTKPQNQEVFADMPVTDKPEKKEEKS